MPPVSLHCILNSLVSLKPAELREVQSRLTILLGNHDLDRSDESIIHRAIKEAFREIGRKDVPSLGMIKRTKYYSTWKTGCAAIIDFVDDHFHGTKVSRVAAITHITGCCIRWARSRMGINLAIVSYSMKSVAEAVDSEYPGYAEAGLLESIIARNGMISGKGATKNGRQCRRTRESISNSVISRAGRTSK